MNTFEAPPRTARVSELPPPPPTARAFPAPPPPPGRTHGPGGTTGQRLLTPDLPGHGAPQGIPRPPDSGPRLSPAPQPQRPNVMTLPPANLLVPHHPSGAPKPAVALNPAGLFDAPSDSINRIKARQRRRRFKNLVSTLVLLTLVAGGVFAWTKFRPKEEQTYPAAWDTRVLPMVQFVQENRGLQFDHPVAIEFLHPDEYKARLTADWVDVSDEERDAASYEEELNDLFGLTATYNLLHDKGAIESLASLGYYSPATDSIVVRGEELTPGVRATVVHELTHALQAQRLDVGGRITDRSTRSIAEADAMEVESSYLDTMTPEDRWYASEQSKLSEEDEHALDAVPWTLTELEYAPYRLGRIAMDRRATPGTAGINAALAEPPSERQMIAPWSGGTSDTTGLVATAPAGAIVVKENQPLSLLETLVAFDAWLPWSMARPALDPWVGGVFTTYRVQEGGPLCAISLVRLSVPGEQFATVVTWWSGAMGAPTTPTVNGYDVSFTMCARGKGAAEPPKAVVPTTVAVELEISSIPDNLMPKDGQPAVVELGKPTLAQYLCVARTVVDDPALGPLVTELFPTPEQQATLDKGFDRAARTCIG